jgi:hypothetical protein
MAAPYSLENTLRVHDEAFYNWLGGLTVDYGNAGGLLSENRDDFPILRIFAGPSRAFASLVNLLVHSGFVSGDTAAKMRERASDFSVLPLPMATIERGAPTIDADKSPPPSKISQAYFDTTTGKWVSHENPATYLIPYTVTIWAIKQYTLNHVEEWLFSQIGKLGAAYNELMVDVAHASPWGTQKQGLKFQSLTDVSELEGENPPYRRIELSFEMRMLHFRSSGASSDQIQTLTQDNLNLSDGHGVSVLPPTTPDIFGPSDQTGNLFVKYVSDKNIPTKWMKEGAATVSKALIAPQGSPAWYKDSGLFLTVNASSDVVDVAHRLLLLDDDGHALVSVAFEYLADGPSRLVVDSRAASDQAASFVYGLDLPTTSQWKRVHFFVPITAKILGVTVEGTGTAASVSLAGIEIRHLKSLPKTAGTRTDVGASVEFAWSSLTASTPCVLYGILNASDPASDASVTFFDSDTNSILSRVVPVTTTSRGVAAIMQPRAGGTTLKASIPKTLSVKDDLMYLFEYRGSFRGHEL